ncbi:unnamed protein product [Adineta steineri]|uniref:LamG-like jellyroll fold domain-containing protein n=1 Tax=Adineta steineri TaxID=433720 RepID=A0A813V7K8_9BILA|nr:unnamed protein product [Adineta steineri]CAF3754462.1 unnamed protein product [Adineta steineri]
MEYITQSIAPIDFLIPEDVISDSSEILVLTHVKFQWKKINKIALRIFMLLLIFCLITIITLIIVLVYKKYGTIQSSSNKTNEKYKRYDILWSFDDNCNDINNSYPGFLVNNPFYINGYISKALSLNGINQYVETSAFINFSNRSFTVEVWVYWIDRYNYTFNGILGQYSCDDSCISKNLHLMIRDKVAYMGFYENDLRGHTIIENSTWTHLAFVYDYEILGQQQVYVNGLFDGRRITIPYKGVKGDIVLGTGYVSAGVDTGRYFTGLIDQLSITLRAKTAAEILEDATLCAYYSFDLGSFADLGPNGLNGSAMNIKIIKGRINEALQFSSSISYFQATGFVALGTSNKSFSIAFWINPLRINKGTIVHVSSSDYSWCLPFIGFDTNGVVFVQIKSDKNTIITTLGSKLQINNWTHVVTTYSKFNGQRVYINGLMYSSSARNISYSASEQSNSITIGTSLALNSKCNQGEIQSEQLNGSIDELRIYNRELTEPEIITLVNT